MSRNSYPLVLVEWEDSCSEDSWRALDGEETGPSQCRTVGWLIHETKGFVTIASTMQVHDGKPDSACCRMNIPKAVIRKRVKLDG